MLYLFGFISPKSGMLVSKKSRFLSVRFFFGQKKLSAKKPSCQKTAKKTNKKKTKSIHWILSNFFSDKKISSFGYPSQADGLIFVRLSVISPNRNSPWQKPLLQWFTDRTDSITSWFCYEILMINLREFHYFQKYYSNIQYQI